MATKKAVKAVKTVKAKAKATKPASAPKKAASNVSSDPWLAQAMDLRKKEIISLNFDPLTAKSAIRAGLSALVPYEAVLMAKYPGFDLAQLNGLPEICDRLQWAQREVLKTSTASKPVASLVQEGIAWRRKLLPLAESLAQTGAIAERDVRRIVAGKGAADNLQDVIDLAELLAPHGKLVELACGAGAFAAARAAATEGLVALGVITGRTSAERTAADLRDRYATLVVSGRDRIAAALAAVVGYRDAGMLVPALKASRSGSGEAPVVEVPPAE